jgi:hypothetical protein
MFYILAISPARTRLENISKKLGTIDKDKLEQSAMKKQELINNLQDKINHKAAANDIQLKILHEKIDKLYEDLDEERRIREDFENDMESNIYPIENGQYLSLEQIGQLVIER